MSFRRRKDEAMFSKISQVPIFTEFREEIEDYEHTKGFLAKYLNAQTHYLDLDNFIHCLEDLQNILDPVEKQRQLLEMSFEGYGPQELYIHVMFSIFGKVLTAVKTFEAACIDRTELDETIIRRAKSLIEQLNEQVTAPQNPEEAMVSIRKLCKLYFKAAKFRDEDKLSNFHEVSEKMRKDILGKISIFL